MFQNTLTPRPISPSQLTFFVQTNCNNERNNFDSYFPFLKPILEAFTFDYIKIIQLMKVQIHMASVRVPLVKELYHRRVFFQICLQIDPESSEG